MSLLPDNDADEPIAPAAAAFVHVMLVIGSEEGCLLLRNVITRTMPQSLIEVAETPLDAMLRLARQPADLMVMDLSTDPSVVPAVIRHAGRISPNTTVLVFDDVARSDPGHFEVHSWSEVECALDHWLHTPRRWRNNLPR